MPGKHELKSKHSNAILATLVVATLALFTSCQSSIPGPDETVVEVPWNEVITIKRNDIIKCHAVTETQFYRVKTIQQAHVILQTLGGLRKLRFTRQESAGFTLISVSEEEGEKKAEIVDRVDFQY